MNELLQKIYDDVLVYEKDTIIAGRPVEEEISRMIKHYQNRFQEEELEEMKDLLSSVALTAKRSGFETGVRFILKLLYAGISG